MLAAGSLAVEHMSSDTHMHIDSATAQAGAGADQITQMQLLNMFVAERAAACDAECLPQAQGTYRCSHLQVLRP